MEVYDPPYVQFEGIDCQVTTGWDRFWYGGPEPYWMDTRVFAASHLGAGWVERIEGDTSQLVIATEPYTAGLQQQVPGLVPGVGYGFHAAMLTIFQTSAPPAMDGTMVKQVGMDPTGGTDPQASTVVWSEPDDHDEGPWDINQRTAVYAQTPAITVFVRVISPYESGGLPFLNYSFLDSAILAQTPVVTATSPAVSADPAFTVNWDNAVPAPGGAELKWRDVQWLDEAEGVWHDWIIKSYDVEAPFAGERGHTYRFRARVWQHYPNGAHLYGPWRPEGDTRTTVSGPRLTGRVLTSGGHSAGGATVAISGTTYVATSGAEGWYAMDVLPWSEPQTVTVSHPSWASPAPVHGLTFGLTETVVLTWTLRPPADAVVNGEFEEGLAGWSVFEDQPGAAEVVTHLVHTGHYALALSSAPPASQAEAAIQGLSVGVTQTIVLTDTWAPVFSFWYRPVTTGTGDLFNAVLTVTTESISPTQPVTVTHVLTPDLETDDWQHVWYRPVGPYAALTGRVAVHFGLKDDGDGAATTVHLDEVSLGASPGGPPRVYLPLALREH
jgi:hypothetical protein